MTWMAILTVAFIGSAEPSRLAVLNLPSQEACIVTLAALGKAYYDLKQGMIIKGDCKQGVQA